MGGIMQRVIDIKRSHTSNPEVVDNYASTVARLDEAMISLASSVKALSSEKMALRASVPHYLAVVSAYQLREDLLGKLVGDPKVLDTPDVVSLYETAKKLRGVAEQHATRASDRAAEITEAVNEMRARRDGLALAKSKLDLAQQLVTSKAHLSRITSLAGMGEAPAITDYRNELRAATLLAKEAEALAELKGLPA